MSDLDLNSALALQLKTLRERAQLTQGQLAELVGVHRNTVYNWESGAGLPTALFLRVCKALDVRAGRILDVHLTPPKGKTSSPKS